MCGETFRDDASSALATPALTEIQPRIRYRLRAPIDAVLPYHRGLTIRPPTARQAGPGCGAAVRRLDDTAAQQAVAVLARASPGSRQSA